MECNTVLKHRTRGEAGRWRSEWSLLVINAWWESREQAGGRIRPRSESMLPKWEEKCRRDNVLYSQHKHYIGVGYHTS